MGKILRRSFLIGSAAIVGGIAFGAYKLNQDHENPLEAKRGSDENPFNPYVTITDDNVVSVYVPRSEMGQGINTSLVAMVSEELDVPVEKIVPVIAPASFAYYNAAMLEDGVPLSHYNRGLTAGLMRSAAGAAGRIFGVQATGGSSSIKDGWDKMREAGATARETLKLAAFKKTGVPTADMKTVDGTVVLPDGTALTYGELAKEAVEIDTPSNVELRDPSTWTVLGKSQPRNDMLQKVTGAPIFGMDVDLPDMLYATVKMNPRLGGPMVSFDATAAKQIKGVVDVVDISRDGDFFGGGFAVIAKNTWAAFKGADAVNAEWGAAPYPATTEAIKAKVFEALDSDDGGDNLRDDGDVALAFADAPRERIVEARYDVPFLAHSTMEPMNATAHLSADGDRLEVWAGTQMPTITRMDCASEAGLDTEQVFVNTTFLGGGFGRRGEVDFTRFATRVAMAVPGRPVKVVWSREEDMTHDTYRPAAASAWRARLGDDGVPVAIDARVACPSIMKSVFARVLPAMSPAGPDNTITHGAFDQPYTAADYRVSGVKADLDIPIGFWRSVGNSYNGFFHESFIDECATKAGMDPLEMRLKLMKDHPTAIKVMETVAEMSDWSAPAKPGRAKGMAFTLSFGTWTGQVVEVEDRDGDIAITNVWCAADMGKAIDPSICRAQLMSGIIYGLSSALGEEITFDDGMVQETNYDTFDAMRMNQCPAIHLELLEEADHVGGMGEPGTPPSIGALANAIYALNGQRIRSMPLSNEVGFV